MYKEGNFRGYDRKEEYCEFCQKDTLHEYIEDNEGHKYSVCSECFKFTDIIEDFDDFDEDLWIRR